MLQTTRLEEQISWEKGDMTLAVLYTQVTTQLYTGTQSYINTKEGGDIAL